MYPLSADSGRSGACPSTFSRRSLNLPLYFCTFHYICCNIYMCRSILFPMQPQTFFDTLADATRRRILALLATQGELCVCELTAALDQIQPKVSRHLGVMKEAGLVIPRREGTWMHYRLATLPAWMGELLAALKSGAAPELRADLTRLKSMRNRPRRAA